MPGPALYWETVGPILERFLFCSTVDDGVAGSDCRGAGHAVPLTGGCLVFGGAAYPVVGFVTQGMRARFGLVGLPLELRGDGGMLLGPPWP